jgi:hypothetical protein
MSAKTQRLIKMIDENSVNALKSLAKSSVSTVGK